MEHVEVIKPGLLSTVQDLGRLAYVHYGVSACGAMDPLSLRLGNLLVGNPEGAAGLEVTLIGPVLRFEADRLIAVSGGNLSPRLNGQPVPMWKAVRVSRGDVLSFGACVSGCRAYIAIAGGIDVPAVMGSRSTYVRGGYGGYRGRALRAGDRVPVGKAPEGSEKLAGRLLPRSVVPDFAESRPVRFVFGPQDDRFSAEERAKFAMSVYTVSPDSDRMGYRLEGPRLRHLRGADILSEFIAVGSIQVPASGQPIVLMADSQMTGGYTKIGVVAGVDIPYMGQRKPGDQIRFQPVTVEEAQREWKKRESLIAAVRLHNRLLRGGRCQGSCGPSRHNLSPMSPS